MLAGVFVNFILALFIYAMILFTWGDTYVPMRNIDQGFAFNERARQFGFQNGDIPLRTDKTTFDRFDSNESMGDVYRGISEARSVTVLRQGKEVTLSLPGEINMIQMMNRPSCCPYPPPLSTACPPVVRQPKPVCALATAWSLTMALLARLGTNTPTSVPAWKTFWRRKSRPILSVCAK